jgi:hypothetical protein
MGKKQQSILGVFVKGEPTTATSIPAIDENKNFEINLSFDVPIDAGKNQVVKLEATSGIEVFSNGTSPYSINLGMRFLRDGDQIFTSNATLTNSEAGNQRIPLAITWADFPPPGEHLYILEIFATANGLSIENLPMISPIGFVVTHIQLAEQKKA